MLECSHEQIHLRWVTDLNDNSVVLAFMCNNEQVYAENEGGQVDRAQFAKILAMVKSECRGNVFASTFKFCKFYKSMCNLL